MVTRTAVIECAFCAFVFPTGFLNGRNWRRKYRLKTRKKSNNNKTFDRFNFCAREINLNLYILKNKKNTCV